MVNLIKKAFTRINDGMTVLSRAIQHEEKAKQEMNCPIQLRYNMDYMNKMFDNITEADKETVGPARNKTIYVNYLSLILRECLQTGIMTDAEYGRRSACLELLVFFHEIFKEKLWVHWWFEDDLLLLKDIVIFDTYETNKQMALKVYKIIAPQKDPPVSFVNALFLKYRVTKVYSFLFGKQNQRWFSKKIVLFTNFII